MTYTVSDYLLDRLASLGATDIFGVPGDFNLQFLDHVIAHKELTWVGNANELNAGYAADGYARVGGIGALVTTYGVGELSAINATAGSYAEHVPVLHIVGAPSKDAQAAHLTMHHTLGDGDFSHFIRMASEVSCAVANLEHATATAEIDRVLREMMIQKRPGYILLATDVARVEVAPPSDPLEVPKALSSPGAAEAFRADLAEVLAGKQTTVLADLLVHRMGAQANLTEMLEATGLPYATLMWGKTLVDESKPAFAGIYAGVVSSARTKDAVEHAQALICAGVTFTDTTTAGFSQNLPENTVFLGAQTAKIGRKTYAPLTLDTALDIVREVASEVGATPKELLPWDEETHEDIDMTAPLTQDVLWSLLSRELSPGNIVVADQGTSFFGMASRRFPENSMFIGQPLWGSIGYTLPAMLGAAIADRQARGVLLIGDGSAQLTFQEIGTMLEQKINPVVVLINNDGYTVERAIHGATQPYNDIRRYNWQLVPAALGATEDDVLMLRVTTAAELLEATALTQATRDKLVFLEIMMDKDDVPALLADVAAALTRANS
ncbi:MAG: alpha-keto acid decarboxylase family protein [Rothia sp. (in: high G+C Gram-positive bacteria)]|uniref:alpha-keto acid decarboxylase family protein n=1 Tax=Rothia sp. (in: high G+C Gram-positive bacteria) TaxID=1885016 RepID=UPI0026F57558|nr:alpha-keto acid decarboxylase family protein [Rothia sp. (in: high G+C Gram-positive bacteria)]